jgi:hypothetical protein
MTCRLSWHQQRYRTYWWQKSIQHKISLAPSNGSLDTAIKLNSKQYFCITTLLTYHMTLTEIHIFSQIYYYISIHSLRAMLILCPASQIYMSMMLLLIVWNKTGWHWDGLKDTFCKNWSDNSKVEMEHITDTQRHHGGLIHLLSAYFPSQKGKTT